MQKISPWLWFDTEAEEAMNYYCSVFKTAKKGHVARLPDGKVLTAAFELEGQEFYALNGGPQFNFTEAVSFYVNCKDQAEVDHYWNRFVKDGGEESMCGWCKDKFGLCWQIIPEALPRLMSDKNAKKASAVTQAMLKMRKIDVAALERAYASA